MYTSNDSTAATNTSETATSMDNAVVEQLRAAVLQALAIKEAHTRRVREVEAAERNDALAKFAAAAPARAAKIIANIPRAILATHSHTVEVMQLDYRESTQSPYAGCNAHEPWDGAKLQYAARAVFDYCERAGLRPYLVASHNYTYDRDYFTLLIPLSQPV